MNEFVLHPVLDQPHTYLISDFRYSIDREEPAMSFIDMTLEKSGSAVHLRFWQPVNLRIESGFPQSTGGLVFYDRSADGLEGVSIEVADFESSWGAITFMARSVERLTPA